MEWGMMLKFYIEIRDSVPMLIGTGVKARMFATMYLEGGASIAEIQDRYNITAAQVHAALAYYYDHRADFDMQDAALAQQKAEYQAATASRLNAMRERAKQLNNRAE